MLGEAVITDMKRRMDLGLLEAARAICCGIVLRLHKGNGGRVRWPPGLGSRLPRRGSLPRRRRQRDEYATLRLPAIVANISPLPLAVVTQLGEGLATE